MKWSCSSTGIFPNGFRERCGAALWAPGVRPAIRNSASFSTSVAMTARAAGLPGIVCTMNVDIFETSIADDVLREVSQPLGPTGSDLAGQGFCLNPKPLEIAVLQTDPCHATGKFLEEDLDFRQHCRVEAKLVIELPTQDEP